MAIALAVYAAAGFWGLPALLRWQLPRLAAAQLQRAASVGEVRFNPFTLRLQLRQLQLAEADGSPLLALDGVVADLEWRSLWQRAWTLGELRLDGPQARLAIAPDGRSNIAQLLDSLQRDRPPQRSEEHALPRLVVEQFTLTGGRIDWDDRQAGYRNTLAPIELQLAHFSTLRDDRQAYTLSAALAGGGRLRWRGEASLDPIRASGELALEAVALPALGAYLKPYVRAVVADGRLSATLPYRLAYQDGRLEGRLDGARLAIDDLAAGHAGSPERFAALRQFLAEGIVADLGRREATIETVRLAGGRLGVRRDARGRFDLAQLLVERAPAVEAAPPAPWKLAVRQLQAEQLALRAVDETVQPPLALTAERIGGRLRLDAAQTPQALAMTLDGGALQIEQLGLAQDGRPPMTLARLGVEGAALDLAAHRASAARLFADGGQLRVVRDAQGRIDLMALLPRASSASASSAPGPAWTLQARQVELARLAVDVEDRGSGLRTRLQDLGLRLHDVGSDLTQPVRFDASLRVREGGELTLAGRVVPASGAVDAQLRLRQLALAPLQPLLARYLRLKLATGAVSGQGRLEARFGGDKPPALRYTGRVEVAGLRLNELDGSQFARWTSVAADRLVASLAGLEIPELRVAGAEASLIIEPDRSFNAARLLVPQPAAPPARPAAKVAAKAADKGGDPYPVRIGRVRLQNARLDFLDQSLRPQFGARIHDLQGVVTGLSSRRDARSQVELDGQVDQNGLARIRGALNPFAPRDNTDLNVVFRNVDMVPASPYAMKFAGYRIAEGRISLDLRYRVREGRLEGENQVVIDRLTLGERVDSPDALKLPIELAISLLKDADGRIDLGLPVSGDLSDPQFSYAGLIGKALVNVLTRVVTAPFRALGRLFGFAGEKLEAIEFDPGSARLLPPEREKLQQVAQLLARREQLRLAVPGRYDEALDGAALRAGAMRAEVLRRAGVRLAPGEAAGPLDLGDRKVRAALRELFVARFGAGELETARQAASRAPSPGGEASGAAAGARPSLLRRLGDFVQGEPRVADAAGFYQALQQRLEQTQPLPAEALPALGTQRAEAIVAALRADGVAVERASTGAPAAGAEGRGKSVALKLELALGR